MTELEEIELCRFVRKLASDFKKEHGKSFIYECRAHAEQEDPKWQVFFGIMYREAIDTAPNDVFAYMWFDLAGSNGDENGAKFRDDIEKKMTEEQIVEAKRLVNNWIKIKRKITNH